MPTQVFIRNTEGRVWGPLEPGSVQLLLEGGLLDPPLMVSLNGLDFSSPELVPEFSDVVPEEVWKRQTVSKPSWVPPTLTPSTQLPPKVGFQSVSSTSTVTLASVPSNVGEFASKGSLSDLSTVQLYGRAAATDATGLFSFVLADRTLEVHFRKGSPERIESNHPQDGLGVFLRQQGLVAEDKLNQAEKEKTRFGGTLLSALFGLGILNPGSAFAHLGQRATALLLHAFTATTGRFTFELKELAAHEAIPLGNRWAVLSDVVRRMPPQEFARRLSNVRTLPVVRANSQIQINDLKLSAVETRALSRIDGTRSLEQLVIDFPSEGDNLYRVAFLLRELGLISFALTREGETAQQPAATPSPSPPPPAIAPVASVASAVPFAVPSAEAPASASVTAPVASIASVSATAPAVPPVAAKPTAATTAAPGKPAPAPAAKPDAAKPRAAKPGAAATKPPSASVAAKPKAAAVPKVAPVATPPPPIAPVVAAPPLNPEIELRELKARLQKLSEESYFQILGVSEATDSATVKASYFRLAKQYHPDTVSSSAPPEMGKLKAELFTSITEAYRVLGEDASRATYLSDLKSGSLDKVDVRAILGAEERFQRATIVFKARRYHEALELIEECIAANPDEGEFYAWRGYGRFIIATDKRRGAADAQRDLAESLKRNPRCGPAHYFSGMIAKASGDIKAAKRHFQNTVDLEPHHVDAQRELRLLAKAR